MDSADGSKSCYFFDIDDNLLFLPTRLYLWNAETHEERVITSGEFAAVQNSLGRSGKWQAWAAREQTFRDFRDQPGLPPIEQVFIKDLDRALAGGTAWQGPSWPLLVHAAKNMRPIAVVTARGHEPDTIKAGIGRLVEKGLLAGIPPIIGVYTVSNPGVRATIGATDPDLTIASIKKMAIRHAVETALQKYGARPPHRFGMSDDDPNNVVLAISAMRDCKVKYPEKRFFVVNTNQDEFVKLEIFPMMHPVTVSASGAGLLSESADGATTSGGNASIYVGDLDRAVQFYTETLGLRLRTRIANEWAEIDAGRGLVVGLHPAMPPETVKPGAIGAINVELASTKPLAEAVAALKARGVRFGGDIQSYPHVKLVSLLDPDGNTIILAEAVGGPSEAGS